MPRHDRLGQVGISKNQIVKNNDFSISDGWNKTILRRYHLRLSWATNDFVECKYHYNFIPSKQVVTRFVVNCLRASLFVDISKLLFRVPTAILIKIGTLMIIAHHRYTYLYIFRILKIFMLFLKKTWSNAPSLQIYSIYFFCWMAYPNNIHALIFD